MAVPFALFTTAYQYASAGFVGLLAALMPLATAIVAHYTVHDEPLTAPKLLGMLVALAGVVLLFASGDSGLDEGGRPELAIALGLGAVVAVGVSSAYARRRRPGLKFTPVPLTGTQFLIGGVVLIPFMLVLEGGPVGHRRPGLGTARRAGPVLQPDALPVVLLGAAAGVGDDGVAVRLHRAADLPAGRGDHPRRADRAGDPRRRGADPGGRGPHRPGRAARLRPQLNGTARVSITRRVRTIGA